MVFSIINNNFWHWTHPWVCAYEPHTQRVRPPLGAPSGLVGPTTTHSLIPAAHSLILSPDKVTSLFKPVVLLLCLQFSISLLGTPFLKLFWEFTLWYLTAPTVQLVFILVFYILQIFTSVVTMFLSLHVEFIGSKVVLMHDIASRHMEE